MTNSSAIAVAALPEAPVRGSLRHWGALFVGMLGFMQAMLGIGLITYNFADIQGALGLSPDEGAMIVIAYFIGDAVTLLLARRMIEWFGTKRIMIALAAVNFVSCIFAIATPSLQVEILFRALQGAGLLRGAAACMAILNNELPDNQKPMAWAVIAWLLGTATVLPSLIAVYLFNWGGWQALYYFEALISFLIFFGSILFFKTEPMGRFSFDRFDVLAILITITGISALSLALIRGTRWWWIETEWIGWSLAYGVAAISVAIVINLNRKNPLIDSGLLFNPHLILVLLINVLFRFASSSSGIAQQFLMHIQGYKNEQMARDVYWLPFVVGTLLTPLIYTICRRFRPTHFMFLGFFGLAVANLLDSHSTILTSGNHFIWTQCILAVFGVLAMMAMVLHLGEVLDPKDAASFTAWFMATRTIGIQMGMAFVASVPAYREPFHFDRLASQMNLEQPLVAGRFAEQGVGALLADLGRQSYVMAYNDTFFAMAMVILASSIFIIYLLPRLFPDPKIALWKR